MSRIDQEQYERVVLFSLMKDAVNVLNRKEVGPRGFLVVDTSERDWTVGLILDLLPEVARAIPLEQASIIVASEGDEADLWLTLPQSRVRAALTAFLAQFLEAAMELGTVAPATKDAVADGIARVVDQVADLWQGRFGL